MRQFKEQQKVATNADEAPSTRESDPRRIKRKLVEINAPGSVIDSRAQQDPVSDAEVDEYYKAHTKDLSSQERVSFREIVLIRMSGTATSDRCGSRPGSRRRRGHELRAGLAAESSRSTRGCEG